LKQKKNQKPETQQSKSEEIPQVNDAQESTPETTIDVQEEKPKIKHHRKPKWMNPVWVIIRVVWVIFLIIMLMIILRIAFSSSDDKPSATDANPAIVDTVEKEDWTDSDAKEDTPIEEPIEKPKEPEPVKQQEPEPSFTWNRTRR